jgi:hypothetical protein
MNYQVDTIDWQSVASIDLWLDGAVAVKYQNQPMAQDWARVAKITEELSEAMEALDSMTDATDEDYSRISHILIPLGKSIADLILFTGQNPRKPENAEAFGAMLDEIADVVFTGILALQHFTKDAQMTRDILMGKLATIYARMQANQNGDGNAH